MCFSCLLLMVFVYNTKSHKLFHWDLVDLVDESMQCLRQSCEIHQVMLNTANASKQLGIQQKHQ